jgi:hypothetical protein
MKKYDQLILTIIAVGIIVLNIQLFKDDIISNANAIESHSHNSYEIYGLDDHRHSSYEVSGIDNHNHYANQINDIENHEHDFEYHVHSTAQIATGLDGDKKVLKDLLEYLINNSHTHFWN